MSGDLRDLGTVKREHVRHVLAACRGNRSRDARILGVDRKTLSRHLRTSEATDG